MLSLVSYGIQDQTELHETSRKRKEDTRGWKVSSAVMSTCCSCRRLRFDSRHPHGGPKPPITPVSGHLVPSSDLCGAQGTQVAHMHTCKTFLHIETYFLGLASQAVYYACETLTWLDISIT